MDTNQNTNYEVLPIFATPLYVSKVKNFNYKFEDEETKKNTGNWTTKNSYLLENPKYSDLKDEIAEHLTSFKNFLGYTCDFRITLSWANFTDKGEYHYDHSHQNSFLSGVVYLGDHFDIDHLSNITFYRETKLTSVIKISRQLEEDRCNICNNDQFIFTPSVGDIIMFHSDIVHEVGINESEETRISLAFNAFPCGVIGSPESKTELRL